MYDSDASNNKSWEAAWIVDICNEELCNIQHAVSRRSGAGWRLSSRNSAKAVHNYSSSNIAEEQSAASESEKEANIDVKEAGKKLHTANSHQEVTKKNLDEWNILYGDNICDLVFICSCMYLAYILVSIKNSFLWITVDAFLCTNVQFLAKCLILFC